MAVLTKPGQPRLQVPAKRASARHGMDYFYLPAFQKTLCQGCHVNSVNYRGGNYGRIDFTENFQYR